MLLLSQGHKKVAVWASRSSLRIFCLGSWLAELSLQLLLGKDITAMRTHSTTTEGLAIFAANVWLEIHECVIMLDRVLCPCFVLWMMLLNSQACKSSPQAVKLLELPLFCDCKLSSQALLWHSRFHFLIWQQKFYTTAFCEEIQYLDSHTCENYCNRNISRYSDSMAGMISSHHWHHPFLPFTGRT